MAPTGHIIEIPFQRCLRVLPLFPHILSRSPRCLSIRSCRQRESRQCGVAEPLVSLELYSAIPSKQRKEEEKAAYA